MNMPKQVSPATSAAQAVQTAACPSARFLRRCKLQKHTLSQATRAQRRSPRHAARALQAEAEEPVTQKKRGRKKSTKPQLPSVSPYTLCLHAIYTFHAKLTRLLCWTTACCISANSQEFLHPWGPWSAHRRIWYVPFTKQHHASFT